MPKLGVVRRASSLRRTGVRLASRSLHALILGILRSRLLLIFSFTAALGERHYQKVFSSVIWTSGLQVLENFRLVRGRGDAYGFSRRRGTVVFEEGATACKISRKESDHEKQIQQKRLQHEVRHEFCGMQAQPGARIGLPHESRPVPLWLQLIIVNPKTLKKRLDVKSSRFFYCMTRGDMAMHTAPGPVWTEMVAPTSAR